MNKHYSFFLRQQLLPLILKSCLAGFIFCFASAAATAQSPGNAMLFVKNVDRFPADSQFVFSRVQIPYSTDSIVYNGNHDSLTVRLLNKGIGPLIINDLILSNDTAWQFVKLKGVPYVPGTSLPITINSGDSADLTVKFVAMDAGTRVKILHDTLTILSNDDKSPAKSVYFSGLWQRQGEGVNEPWAKEIIRAFGFKTQTGFYHTDPDLGDSTKLKGDEIRPSYFIRADTSRPVFIRQMGAYHGCCTQTESIMWYPMGTDSLVTIFSHYARDAQSLLPRKVNPGNAASGSISPATAFGFKVGHTSYTDASKNPQGKICIRVWKAFNAIGNIIPNSYIISLDYPGNAGTNYDYNDNMYYVTNVRPERGTAYFSALAPAPSDLDFGEKLLNSNSSLTLNLSSLGQKYADSSADPAIIIDSVAITGENKSEFATMPVTRTLYPQQSTTLTVNYNPVSQGLKIADLLVYYNNAQSPLRVPLYGIAKAADTTVIVNYRINSGSPTPITINGKTWSADNQYAFDNIEPYRNNRLHQIAGTDEDSLYLKEQSSNGTKRPFRYEFPIENGDYVVRLHFAEIYWGAPGSGINGGAGSRVMEISLENQLRLINLDVTQEAGGGATALVKNIPVTVTDGKLNINFSSTLDRPMVVAVEVYSFRASTILASVIPDPVVPTADNNLKKPKVYPNPLEKRFKIEFPSEYSGYSTVQIADAAGRTYEIGKTKLQRGRSNSMEVDISSLSLKPGFYYLKLLYETRPTDVIKLIVK